MTELTPELLLQAYAGGVFPMAESRDDPEVFWVDPDKRGVLPLDGFHISRSLRKAILKEDYQVTLDRDFAGVVRACADREETWINDTIFDLYRDLHRMGFAHSLEVWDGDSLIGGTYGVALAGAFFGESMFSRRTNGSKIALAYLVDHLREAGFILCDTQFLTEHLASLGGVEVSRKEYRQKLAKALQVPADFTQPSLPAASTLIQRSTQTS